MNHLRQLTAVALACFLAIDLAQATADEVDYVRDIKPLLTEKCGACHSAVRQKGELRLDAGRLIHQGGESGAVIKPGKSSTSLLIQRITDTAGETRMPPEGEGKPLSPAEIDRLRRWIDSGATFPADEIVASDPRDHWSFRTPVRPSLPTIKSTTHGNNPIDAFILARQRERGLSPQAEAPRAILLRRVYMDLIGLPPTRDELHAFIEDPSVDAYEQIVERLLNRIEYGERWGRHWMDVWRYCDWHGSGNEIRYSQRHIWRWRDWIVQSLNADKPYDRMIVEMLAGDEVAPEDPQVVAATGFIGRNWYKFDRNVWMRELVEHAAVGFLGMTLKCARCHDHKFDPISQEEYYRFRAFFEPHHVRIDRLSAATELESFVDAGPVYKDGLARAFDKDLNAATYVFQRGDDRYPQKERTIAPGVPAVLGGATINVQPIKLPLASYAPMLQPKILDELRSLIEKKIVLAEQAWRAAPHDALLAKRLEHARAERRSTLARIAADTAKVIERADEKRAAELSAVAAQAERESAVILAEINFAEADQSLTKLKATPPADDKAKQALAAAEKKLADTRKALDTAQANLKKTDSLYTSLGEVYPDTSTGRRLALAKWIADAGNPRTARVAINHIWLRHFGRALADSVADFGLRSKTPSHPELLDWLAVELVEHQWSMKHIHRLIVTSATYRQSSISAPSVPNDSSSDTASTDSENLFLAAMNSRRLEAETVRDSVLFIADSLDTKMGGREIPFTQDQTVPRRSLYFQTAPNRQSMMLELFDVASPEECYDRRPSVIPQQSLALLNGSLTNNAARRVTEKFALLPDSEFIVAVFETVLSRPPTSPEAERCLRFLHEQTILLTDKKSGMILPESTTTLAIASPGTRARENLVLVLLNHNDFVTVR